MRRSKDAEDDRPADASPIVHLDLLPHLDDELWILDENLCFAYLNRPNQDGWQGTHVLDRVLPASRDAFQRALVAAKTEGTVQKCVCAWTNDCVVECRIVPLTGGQGEQRMMVTIRDVTAERRAQLEREESEARLRSALDASGIGSWSWSMLTGALVWDPRMCEIWGLSAPPDSYATYLATMHPDDLERVKSLVEKCLTSGHFEEFEHRIVRPAGEVRHLLCRAMAVVDADGTTVGIRGGAFDVTDRKLLEERLRNAQRLQAVGQLTAGIAHNFNNLLGIILPSVELCRDAPPSQTAGYLNEIEEAAERAADMVRQLMQFGRHEAGAPKRAVDLQRIVGRLLHICRTTFDPSVVIQCDVPPERLPILASDGEMEQVLLNICVNARDALQAAQTPAPVIRIALEPAGEDMVRLRISDNGPGMPSDVRDRIFEPFFTTKGLGRGTGLGLASAYGIMRDHGGSIVCESELGKGTSFVIEVPRTSEAALDESRPRATGRSAPANTETVLLVDDEIALRKVLRIILEQAGFHVLEAHDGVMALEVVARHGAEIDVAVLDRSMPRLSGDQLLLELRRRGFQMPVIFLTGQGSAHLVSEPGIPILLKPPGSGELVRAIRTLLQGPDDAEQ